MNERERVAMICQATMDDLDEIYHLICLLENKKMNKEHFKKCYQEGLENSDVLFLVEKNEKIEGFISFYIHHYLHHHHDTGEIVELVVLPDQRNKKIGHHLIEAIIQYAKSRNLEQIDLSTSTYRHDAHRFYENHHFEKSHYNYTLDIK